MDILNWLFTQDQNLIRPTINNKNTDLIAMAADVSFDKRQDKWQTYAMTAANFAPALYNTGNVTQATSITTGVTVNAATGIITTFAATTAANSTEATGFVVTNSLVKATSKIQLSCQYAGAANGIPTAIVSAVGAGSFTVILGNGGSAALNALVRIHFTVID